MFTVLLTNCLVYCIFLAKTYIIEFLLNDVPFNSVPVAATANTSGPNPARNLKTTYLHYEKYHYSLYVLLTKI